MGFISRYSAKRIESFCGAFSQKATRRRHTDKSKFEGLYLSILKREKGILAFFHIDAGGIDGIDRIAIFGSCYAVGE